MYHGGKQLNLANNKITDLSGIEIFEKYNIEWLYLDNNNISDLTPIANFKSLTKINASNNNIEDLTPLSQLSKLSTVNFTNNEIKDISQLRNLTQMEYLFLKNNEIKEIDILTNNLKEIYCSCNKLKDVEKFSNLTNLKMLDIKNQTINLYTSQDINTEYVCIKLPQIFDMIDEFYTVSVPYLSYYEFEEGYKYIKIYTEEYIAKGLNIKVSKKNNIYINYFINADSSVDDTVKTKYNVKKLESDVIITGIDVENGSVNKFIENSDLGNNYSMVIYKNNEILDSNKLISTGSIVRIYNSEKEYSQDYTVVIYGDVNGDGKINASDALKIIYDKINDNYKENDIYSEAARTTLKTRQANGIPNALDALAVVKNKLTSESIIQ